ncbi:TPA: ACT domain-containing protein [Streptococcus suis]|nr:ACT domain-containing protein [Streptococcus suis]HEM3684471.1 ACT domain-containing protein [Streptococcus suis]HEM3696272.1 ACT domain-containing protein [Streptococcus suis]HEM3701751.1 ACT domain-containing protein [Streptococcus suis]HEM3717669.1 ACT domain-containing protein [Streptococcus suis]
MKAIVTVVGKDKSGIVAGVATKIAELGLNIDDISQTVLDEYFTMMAVVSSDEKQDFTQLRAELDVFGQSLNVKINIQSAAIFDAMHNL